jgi:hypothetical protein
MSDIKDLVINWIFTKIPLLSLLDGYKTKIGELLAFLSALDLLLLHYFPTLPYVNQIDGWVVLLSGLAVRYLGIAHADAKENLK